VAQGITGVEIGSFHRRSITSDGAVAASMPPASVDTWQMVAGSQRTGLAAPREAPLLIAIAQGQIGACKVLRYLLTHG
jgi:hypothetical protein